MARREMQQMLARDFLGLYDTSMKTPGISSVSHIWLALTFSFFLHLTTGARAQANSRTKVMDFFGAIQAGRERDALAMLENDTNLVRAVENMNKHPLLEAAAAGEV